MVNGIMICPMSMNMDTRRATDCDTACAWYDRQLNTCVVVSLNENLIWLAKALTARPEERQPGDIPKKEKKEEGKP